MLTLEMQSRVGTTGPWSLDCEVSGGAAMIISTVAVLIYISTNSVKDFLFPPLLHYACFSFGLLGTGLYFVAQDGLELSL